MSQYSRRDSLWCFSTISMLLLAVGNDWLMVANAVLIWMQHHAASCSKSAIFNKQPRVRARIFLESLIFQPPAEFSRECTKEWTLESLELNQWNQTDMPIFCTSLHASPIGGLESVPFFLSQVPGWFSWPSFGHWNHRRMLRKSISIQMFQNGSNYTYVS